MTISRSPSPENDVFSLPIIPERTNKVAGTSSVDFDGLLSLPLRLHEDLKEGCGGQLWPAGLTLSEYMLKYNHDLTGKTVLEIGAGGGLVGLAVAMGCRMDKQQKIIMTDQIPMLRLMQKNISLNNRHAQVEGRVYDWGSPMPEDVSLALSLDQTPSHQHPDIVLAADCVYFEPAFPLLLSTLGDIIGPNTTCFFCFKKRRKADMRFIKDMMKKFQVEQIEYPERERKQREGIWLYKVTLK